MGMETEARLEPTDSATEEQEHRLEITKGEEVPEEGDQVEVEVGKTVEMEQPVEVESDDLESGLGSPLGTPRTPQQEGIDTDETEISATKRKDYETKLKGTKMTLRELVSLENEISRDFPDTSDSLFSALNAAKKQRRKKKRQPLESIMESGAGPRTVKDWSDFVAKCEKELPSDDSVLKNAREKWQDRKASHREPIANELQTGKELTLKRLSQLQRKAIAELGAQDPLLEDLKSLVAEREQSHKAPLVARYTKLMKGKLKDLSVRALNEFSKACEDELDPEDPLLAQARSACEARVLNKGDPSKAKVVGKKKKKEKSKDAEDDVVLKIPGIGASSSRSNAKDKPKGDKASISKILSSVVHEFSGVEDTLSIKAAFLFAFLLFAYILLSYLQLVLQIAPFTLTEPKAPVISSEGGS